MCDHSGCSSYRRGRPLVPGRRRPSAMASSPHSQSPPRAGTPAPQTPSRLVIAPSLRPTHSLSNLHVHMSGLSPGPVSTTSHTGEESSASSIINVDMGEGILVPEADAEVGVADGEVGNAYVSASSPIGDEASKKALRDHLRNTLSKKGSYMDADAASRRSRRRKMSVDADVEEVSLDIADAFPPRQYFVLTDAGKPVFTSRSIEHDPDNLASTMGIMQALISVFLDDGDKLRCVNAGSTRINILMRPPLYYACVSSWGEPESVKDTLPSRVLALADFECCNRHPTTSNLRASYQLRSRTTTRRIRDSYSFVAGKGGI